jgi:hypothetical protein
MEFTLMATRRRLRRIMLTLLLAVAFGTSGCTEVQFLAGLGGFALGRLSFTGLQITTTERVCFQDGVQIPCP